jgi:mannobiose 2-epimerase
MDRYKLLNKNIALAILILLICIRISPTWKNMAERRKLANELENSIHTELLNKWYPMCVDSLYGGFITTFTYDFKPTGEQDKMIVTQARHVWSNSIATRLYPNEEQYKYCARQGFAFLKNIMWDKVNGGFYSLVDRQGRVKDTTGKTSYGNAFGIYACTAWYLASGDTNALNLARKCFWWLEQHCHDPLYKGYFQDLSMEGTPKKRAASASSLSTIGYKDQNSSIHLLEAFTELYFAWPVPLLKERLQEMLLLIRDVITTEKGSLTLFLQPDWTPISYHDSSEAVILEHRYIDHVSFGHDVETAFLMLEASEALGMKNDATTLATAKRMVDHALKNGWDNKNGGFYDEGYYFKNKNGITIIRDSKNWWSQAEGLNTLLMMADLFPKDQMQYYRKFKEMWHYIQTYIIDHHFGDWFEEGLDTRPERETALKGHIWKATYHQFRSLSNCVKRLRD